MEKYRKEYTIYLFIFSKILKTFSISPFLLFREFGSLAWSPWIEPYTTFGINTERYGILIFLDNFAMVREFLAEFLVPTH